MTKLGIPALVLGFMIMTTAGSLAGAFHYQLIATPYRRPPPSLDELTRLGNIVLYGTLASLIGSLLALWGLILSLGLRLRRASGLVLILSLAIGLGSLGFMSLPASIATQQGRAVVQVRNFVFTGSFIPSEVRVVIGVNNTVEWIVEAGNPHPENIVSDDGLFESGLLNPGLSWQFTFQSPGSYRYHSSIHTWMRGVVIVISV